MMHTVKSSEVFPLLCQFSLPYFVQLHSKICCYSPDLLRHHFGMLKKTVPERKHRHDQDFFYLDSPPTIDIEPKIIKHPALSGRVH